jgi:sodium-dependent dicarboxylate transporter 2/3/5
VTETEAAAPTAFARHVRRAGLVAGPLLAALAYAFLPRSFVGSGGELVELGAAAPAAAALLVWMAVWWMTEAVDVEATALLPLVAGPILGLGSIGALSAPYASPLVYLFLGGFLLALALQRSGLDRRLALLVLARIGTRPGRIVGGFMLVTALLSSIVSNTATVAAMLPLAHSVARRLGDEAARSAAFATALMLGVAYAASIGGVATLIGTPPNGFLAQYAAESLGQPILFVEWLGIGGPMALAMLVLTWWLLTRVLFRLGSAPSPGAAEVVRREVAALAPLGAREWTVLAVFALAVAAWVLQPFLGLAFLTDAGIAITAGLLVLVLPVGGRRVVEWRDTRELPFGVLVLFGGGLSLAAAIESSGLDGLIGAQCRALADLPPLLLVAALTLGTIFMTEVMSNSAAAAILVPIAASMARELGLAPLELAVPVAVAASFAFMLPAGTPPNAMVFASGRVTLPQMARAGFVLNLVGAVVIVVASRLLVG